MKHFATRTCPLCSKKLRTGDEDSVYDYWCEEFYLRNYGANDFLLMLSDSDWTVGGGRLRTYIKEPHYSVKVINGKYEQSTIIPPYWILSTEEYNKTKIYKFSKEITLTEQSLLLEVPLIVPSDYLPDQFARKIKNLVIFS